MVGMSMGSWIATQYAVAFPDRVDRLALIGPVGLVSGLRLRSAASVLRNGDSAVGGAPRVVPRHSRYAGGPWAAAAGPVATDQSAVRCRHYGLQIRAYRGPFGQRGATWGRSGRPIPVLVIIGRNELLHDGPKMAARFRQRLPEARIEVIDDANPPHPRRPTRDRK